MMMGMGVFSGYTCSKIGKISIHCADVYDSRNHFNECTGENIKNLSGDNAARFQENRIWSARQRCRNEGKLIRGANYKNEKIV